MDDALPESDQRRKGLLRTLMDPFAAWGGRRNIANLAGVTFNGRRDTYEALGYKRILYTRDYRGRYRRGGVAKRIVDAMPNSCWRGGGSVYNDENPQVTTEFEQAFIDLNKRLKVWSVFERADILAGLGRYAIILIGAPGDMNKPLDQCNADDIFFLTPYDEADAFITQYETDWKSPRFGRPIMYALRRTYVQWPGQMNPPVLPAKPVHFSRVIHIADGLLDDHVFGIPRMEASWNYLDDLDKVVGGGAEAYWKRADGGTVYNIDKDMVFDNDPAKEQSAKDEMKQKMSEFTHELEKQLIVRGIDVKRLGSDVADIKNPVDSILSLVSAVTGIPQRILMGSEMGKMASSKDKSNWDDRVQDRRTNFCENEVAFPFIDRMIKLGALPDPGEKGYEVDWPETDELDQGQRVSAAVQISNVNKNEGTPVVTPSEIRTVYLGLEPFTPEQQAEADKIKQEKLAAQQPQGPQPQAPGASAQPTEVPGAVPSTDDKATLAAALRSALEEDDFVLAESLVARAMGGPGSGPQGGKFKEGDRVRHQILPKTGTVTSSTDTHATVKWDRSNGQTTSEKHSMLMSHSDKIAARVEKAAADEAKSERSKEDSEL